MIREFSEEKKEELYRIFAAIDDSPCGSFLEWCQNRRYEFGDWMDKLDIPSYMGRIDRYEMKLLDMNASIRTQIDTVFSNVYDIDRNYGEIFRNYGEIVEEQEKRIDEMWEILRSGNDSRDAGSTEDEYPFVITDEKLDRYIAELEKKKAEEEALLDRCLQGSGYTNSAERQCIIDMIRENRPELLSNLAVTDKYSSSTRDTILEQILLYYNEHKNDKKLEAAEEILRNYLSVQGIDSVKQQEIVDMIRKENPNMLLNLYITNCYSSSDTEAVLRVIMKKYEQRNQYYTGKYSYPAAYIEGILKAYETHAMVNGRFVPDNGGATIGYGHDIVEGEDFSNGLSEEEAMELAIADLDAKYDDVILCIEQINDLAGKNISINDFSENEIMFFVDFEYNRGRGLVAWSEIPENQPHTSLALLIIAVSEDEDEKIVSILKEEVCNTKGIYYSGLERRRMDEYEILKYGDYENDEDLERGVW